MVTAALQQKLLGSQTFESISDIDRMLSSRISESAP